MSKTAIVTSRVHTKLMVGITEMEKPLPTNKINMTDYTNSFRWYSVKDEREIRMFVKSEFYKTNSNSMLEPIHAFLKALHEGIEISSDLIEIKDFCDDDYHYCKSHGKCTLKDCKSKQYAILKPEYSNLQNEEVKKRVEELEEDIKHKDAVINEFEIVQHNERKQIKQLEADKKELVEALSNVIDFQMNYAQKPKLTVKKWPYELNLLALQHLITKHK